MLTGPRAFPIFGISARGLNCTPHHAGEGVACCNPDLPTMAMLFGRSGSQQKEERNGVITWWHPQICVAPVGSLPQSPLDTQGGGGTE